MSKAAVSSAAALPDDIQTCLDSFEASLDQVQAALDPFLNKNLADLTADLPPAEKAKLQLLLAYSCNALFYMYLKTQGANVQQHPVTSELNRVKEYFAKLKNATEKAAGAPDVAASGPSLRLDKEASKRVVKHSLPRQQEAQAPDKKKRGGDNSDSSSSSSSSSSNSSSSGSSESESDSDAGKGHSKKSKKGKSKSGGGKGSDAVGKSSKGKPSKDKGVNKKKDKKEKDKKKKDKKKGGK